MLTARVRVTATDEGRQTLIDTLSAEAASVPTTFEGCELFVVSVDTHDPNTVMIAEEWATKDDFDTYVASDHFKKTMAIAGPCLAAPPDSAYYQGDRVGP
ncbi:putative quinol monooxygenase [Euzebya tangerina]|uniref:putative quinol monooxygenase n=1 Tax=Euzebya tangerina TaxID=591198 RepID=UPI000E3241D3|nr:antibiotic biosynthesis monooxygenase [Euzebya tangerina]